MSSTTADADAALVALSAQRIAADVATLSGPQFTSSPHAICRYAFTPEYARTLEWLAAQLEPLGFDCGFDAIGTFVARNRPSGAPVFGVGSHCDSNRNGGPYDGTLGVLAALELCRLAPELPLQVVAFLEEEGSGFGEMLLGSRFVSGALGAHALATDIRAIDDGRTFAEHAADAGFTAERDAVSVLDGLTAWIELHIEQGRVLEDNDEQLGIVGAIAGYAQGDLAFSGRADHAGATPMDLRADAGVAAAACVVALERLAHEAGGGTVATAGELVLEPGILNVIPRAARVTYDIRGTDAALVSAVLDGVLATAGEEAAARGLGVEHLPRHRLEPVPLDADLADAAATAASARGVRFRRMASGAAHDTMCVAPLVPSALLFVPCRDGVSHSPEEWADTAHAARGVHVMLDVLRARA